MSNRLFSPYPARNEQRLPTLKPTEHPKSRTLRMSPIPTTVNEDGLRNYLNSLACEEGPVKDNVLALSLAPFIECLVATVTFRQDPLVFVQCRPRNIVSITLPSILDKSRDPEEITVDCDFHGITPLYHPPGEPSYDLIAVPGLSAHAFGSWRSRAAGHVMWLRDFLRKDFPNFRILLWGYDSDLQDTAAQNTIRGFARQLLIAAHSARDGDGMDKNRPIIFVAHSLGGLVVKQVRFTSYG
ncbi:hypothetical protein K440DRAFT_625728 [Wilcoxina mikolae CBS 423.85]|nr:hypothetical protein K440DRAFT_625728 [Wilcoxina mikolae CBS 423.85]